MLGNAAMGVAATPGAALAAGTHGCTTAATPTTSAAAKARPDAANTHDPDELTAAQVSQREADLASALRDRSRQPHAERLERLPRPVT